MTRIAVMGGREHVPTEGEMARFWAFWRELDGTVLVHGAARGVDSILAEAVKARGFEVDPYPVSAELDGGPGIPRVAWPCRRNGRMLCDGQPIALAVFIGNSGTADCERKSQKMGIQSRRMYGTEQLAIVGAS